MLKQENLKSERTKEAYIKPEYETIIVSAEGILCGSNFEGVRVENTDVDDFLPGAKYETSVF